MKFRQCVHLMIENSFNYSEHYIFIATMHTTKGGGGCQNLEVSRIKINFIAYLLYIGFAIKFIFFVRNLNYSKFIFPFKLYIHIYFHNIIWVSCTLIFHCMKYIKVEKISLSVIILALEVRIETEISL